MIKLGSKQAYWLELLYQRDDEADNGLRVDRWYYAGRAENRVFESLLARSLVDRGWHGGGARYRITNAGREAVVNARQTFRKP